MTTQNTEKKYFDLHTIGIGYLNRIRTVSPKKGQPFLAVTIAALRGSMDDVEYSYIDCNVVGENADKLIRRCIPAEKAGKKILVQFRIGDIRAESFMYEKGEKIGQTGVSLKGRLLFINWIKVDGNEVYNSKSAEAETAKISVQPAVQPESA